MLQAMANDAKHLALPLTHAVIVSLRWVNGYSNGLCDSDAIESLLLPSLLCFLPSLKWNI
jgi:hypothetical protein